MGNRVGRDVMLHTDKEGLTEKVTFKQRSEGNETWMYGRGLVARIGSTPGTLCKKCKASGRSVHGVLGIARRPVGLQWSEEGQDQWGMRAELVVWGSLVLALFCFFFFGLGE